MNLSYIYMWEVTHSGWLSSQFEILWLFQFGVTQCSRKACISASLVDWLWNVTIRNNRSWFVPLFTVLTITPDISTTFLWLYSISQTFPRYHHDYKWRWTFSIFSTRTTTTFTWFTKEPDSDFIELDRVALKSEMSPLHITRGWYFKMQSD